MNKKIALFITLFLSIVLVGTVIADESVTNNYYTIYVDDSNGLFTIGTGASHPFPSTNVLYAGGSGSPGTSWFSIQFYSEPDGIYYYGGLVSFFTGIATDTNTLTETWVIDESFFANGSLDADTLTPNAFTFSRTFTVYGDSYATSYVGIETTFTNNTSSSVSFGFLDMWDLMIASNDDAIMRTIGPVTPWTGDFIGWYPPSFSALEVSDDVPPDNSFSIYIPFVGEDITPSIPDEFVYGEWSDCGYWGYVPTGGDEDSGVSFLWGPTDENAITLDPAESVTFMQYISTNASALDIVIDDDNVSPASFIPLYRVKLQQATEMWQCILSQLPEEISAENALLIDSVQTFMNGAISLTNPVYASGQLSKALEQMALLQEALDIQCMQ